MAGVCPCSGRGRLLWIFSKVLSAVASLGIAQILSLVLLIDYHAAQHHSFLIYLQYSQFQFMKTAGCPETGPHSLSAAAGNISGYDAADKETYLAKLSVQECYSYGFNKEDVKHSWGGNVLMSLPIRLLQKTCDFCNM